MARLGWWKLALAGAVGSGGCAQPDRPTAGQQLPPAAAPSVAIARQGQPPPGDVVPAAATARQTDRPQPAPADAPAQAPPLTLEYLEDIALRVNPIPRRDFAQTDAARGLAAQAGLFPNPQFSSNNPWVFNGRASLLNVGFQQEIPVMGKKKLDQAAANENTRQQEITTEQDVLTLLTRVRQQFYTVLADQRRVEVLTELAEVARRSYEAGEKKRKAGDATLADVLILQTDYQRVLANLRSATAILDGDRKQLGAIVGAPGLIDRPVVGRLTGAYPTFDERRLLEYVANDHTSIRNLRSVVVQNQFLLRRAEVEPYPNPTLGPAYQIGLVPGSDQFWFNFSFPIPAWDRNQGNIRATRANLATSVAQVEVTRNDLVNQASNAISQYLAARALVEEFEAAILPKSAEAARLVREGYAKGIVDLATFLTAQRAAIQANSDYVDALQNLWTNAAQVAGLLQMARFPAGEPATPPAPSTQSRP
jgi:cobalt-zinc-cadmium efflux system outer membrane protein